jgi:hypothetical protein
MTEHTSKNGVTISQSWDGSFWRIFPDDRPKKLICGSAVGDVYLPLWYLRKIKGSGIFNFKFPDGV